MENLNTLEYYNNNAKAFVDGTIDVDFKMIQDRFISYLNGSKILDFGCGSGRDTKYFIKKGLVVDATDGSKEICEIAKEYTGLDVKQMLFQDLDEENKYDGIWACASILHLPQKELKHVFNKMIKALVLDGVIYTSFKYGCFEGYRNGRFFTDFTIDTFIDFIKTINHIEIIDWWVSSDARVGREEEKWLNLIMRKTNS